MFSTLNSANFSSSSQVPFAGNTEPLDSDTSLHTIELAEVKKAASAGASILESISSHAKIEGYSGPGYTNLPGSTSILYAPIDFFTTVLAFAKAYATNDQEGQFDTLLRLSGTPISFAYGALSSLQTIFQIAAFFKADLNVYNSLKVLSLPIVIFGLVLCVIEGIYESIYISRQVQFIKSFCPTIKEKAEKTFQSKLEALDGRFLRLSEKELNKIDTVIKQSFPVATETEKEAAASEKKTLMLSVKKADLDRRVRPWMREKIEKELNPILENLKSPDASVRHDALIKADLLMKNIDIQSKKILLIHVISLVAIILCAIGLIATVAGCPYLIPLILLGAAGIIGYGNYIYSQGTLDEEGWRFSKKKAIPSWITAISKVGKLYVSKVAFTYSKVVSLVDLSLYPKDFQAKQNRFPLN